MSEMSLNLRNILGKLILVFFLFILSFELILAVPVDVTFEPDSYYSDTKDVNLIINYESLSGNTTYNWTLSELDFSLDDCWNDPEKIDCTFNAEDSKKTLYTHSGVE